MATKPIAIVGVIITSFLTAVAQVFYKYASETFRFNIIAIVTNLNLWIAAILYLLALVLLLYSFKHGELSVLYPFIALSYIWVSILSIYLIGEIMTFFKWAGVFSIIVGVSLIGMGGRK